MSSVTGQTTAINKISESEPLRVFLCHSSEDKRKVRNLCGNLRRDGIDPWLDEERLLPGQDWEQEIRKAVKNSDAVVVCLSNGSINKQGFIQKELRFALDIADEQTDGIIFLIPLKLEECELPDRLKHLHYVELFRPKGYERLLDALQVRATSLETRQQINKRSWRLSSNAYKWGLRVFGFLTLLATITATSADGISTLEWLGILKTPTPVATENVNSESETEFQSLILDSACGDAIPILSKLRSTGTDIATLKEVTQVICSEPVATVLYAMPANECVQLLRAAAISDEILVQELRTSDQQALRQLPVVISDTNALKEVVEKVVCGDGDPLTPTPEGVIPFTLEESPKDPTRATDLSAPFVASPYVYRIKASNCIEPPEERLATGFRVQHLDGIVTALHAVLGCRNIVAISDNDGIFTDLTLSKVDISHDITLLETEELLSGQPDGLVTISLDETFEYDQLYVIGYPLGVPKQRPSLDIQVINIATLGV